MFVCCFYSRQYKSAPSRNRSNLHEVAPAEPDSSFSCQQQLRSSQELLPSSTPQSLEMKKTIASPNLSQWSHDSPSKCNLLSQLERETRGEEDRNHCNAPLSPSISPKIVDSCPSDSLPAHLALQEEASFCSSQHPVDHLITSNKRESDMSEQKLDGYNDKIVVNPDILCSSVSSGDSLSPPFATGYSNMVQAPATETGITIGISLHLCSPLVFVTYLVKCFPGMLLFVIFRKCRKVFPFPFKFS